MVLEGSGIVKTPKVQREIFNGSFSTSGGMALVPPPDGDAMPGATPEDNEIRGPAKTEEDGTAA